MGVFGGSGGLGPGEQGRGGLGLPRRRRLSSPFMGVSPPFSSASGQYAGIGNSDYEWPRIVLALVTAEFDNYLVCNCYTSEQLANANPDQFKQHPPPFDGKEFAVAKPFLLQRAAWDGQQITYPGFDAYGGGITVSYTYLDIGLRTARDVAGVEDDERQRITPDYFVNDILCIARGRGAAGDWTGLTRRDPQDQDADNSPIEWMDLNCGGRAWAVWEE